MFDHLKNYKPKKTYKFLIFKSCFPFILSAIFHSIIVFALLKTSKLTPVETSTTQGKSISVSFHENSSHPSKRLESKPKEPLLSKTNKAKEIKQIKKQKTLTQSKNKNFKIIEENFSKNKANVDKGRTTPSLKPEASFQKNMDDLQLIPNDYNPKATWNELGSNQGKEGKEGFQRYRAGPENPVGPLASPRPKIVHRSYDYAGYFMGIDRLFSNAWGGTRFLPRNSKFHGISGEVIEYEIVINRDGSLNRISNITAKKARHRDFSDVDDLVSNVFKNVFPIQPVPNRIPDDPLVMTKRIVFEGYYQFDMF